METLQWLISMRVLILHGLALIVRGLLILQIFIINFMHGLLLLKPQMIHTQLIYGMIGGRK